MCFSFVANALLDDDSFLLITVLASNPDCPWCVPCRSSCQSVRATETASCLSTTCCSGRTPAPAPPNTSTWTTSVNQVSWAAQFSPLSFPLQASPLPCHPFFFVSPHPRSAEHKRHVVCDGGMMILRCKPPRVLNIYAAVYGRSLGESGTCPSHLTRPPPFGESELNIQMIACLFFK